MTVSLAGAAGKSVDLKAVVEFAASADTKLSDKDYSRIADRLGDRLREIDAGDLTGAEGARVVKNAVSAAVSQELGMGRVRAVLIESMVVR